VLKARPTDDAFGVEPVKLVLAIVPQKDAAAVTHGLVAAQFQVTRFASTGGFLRRGNVTLLIGTDDAKVDEVLAIVKRPGGSRGPSAQGEGGTALVLNVAQLIRVDGGAGEASPVT